MMEGKEQSGWNAIWCIQRKDASNIGAAKAGV